MHTRMDTRTKQTISKLTLSPPQQLYLRDGEVVMFKRPRSAVWQCRFKQQNNTWVRLSTKKTSIENAIAAACLIYDEARFRQKLGLAIKAETFEQIAITTISELQKQLDAGNGKVVYKTYITCIEKYFLPYFADRQLEAITHADVTAFEQWRNRQMTKTPKASTLNNFASAWNRLIQTAIDMGWISERIAIPKLSTAGLKSKPRPAFNREEINQLLAFMPSWSERGRFEAEKLIRPVVRDYVEILLYTGIRHGTEAMGLCWNHVEWYTKDRHRYLRIWVEGKTGGRWLIAKHQALEALQRCHQRQASLQHLSFDQLLESRTKLPLFLCANGYRPPSFIGTFRRLLRDCGLLKSLDGQDRTLYSLRHTYATFELLEHKTDIHTLSKQMGNSAAMIERHYSKLTATMAADKLA